MLNAVRQIIEGQTDLKGKLNVDSVTVFLNDEDSNVLFGSCSSIPSAKANYAVGCLLILTGTGKLYQNEGTTASCSFNSIGDIATADIGANTVTPIKMGTRTLVALTDAAATPTIAQLMTSSVFTITPTVARTFTTPTAALMVAGISGCTIGTWFDFTIVNLAAFPVTVTAGSNVTTKGNMIVNNGAATFRVLITTITGNGAAVIYRLASDISDGTTFNIGNYAASYATGSGVVFSASKTSLVRGYGESTSDLTSAYNCRVGVFRHLVVTASATVVHETYGAIGQVCVKNTTLTHLHAGLMGTFEVDTAATLNSTYLCGHAGVIARVGASAAAITATTPLAGFLAFYNASASLASGYSHAYSVAVVNTSYPWSIGLYMPVGTVKQGIRVGNWVGSAALGSAIPFSTAQDFYADGQLDVVGVYGESTADLTSAYSAKCGRYRHVINGITANHETYGLIGQVVAKNVTYGHLHGGLMGTFEVNTAATVNGAYDYGVGAVIARLGVGTSILTCTKPISAFSAVYNGGALVSGSSVAYSSVTTTSTNFTYFAALNDCDNFLYAAAGVAYEHGVKVASISHTAGNGNMDGVLRIYVGATPYYIPFYAAGSIGGE